MPINKVNAELREFSMPVSELSILVSARGYRKAGNPLPKNPIIRIDRKLFFLNFDRLRSATGSRHIDAISILREAS